MDGERFPEYFYREKKTLLCLGLGHSPRNTLRDAKGMELLNEERTH